MVIKVLILVHVILGVVVYAFTVHLEDEFSESKLVNALICLFWFPALVGTGLLWLFRHPLHLMVIVSSTGVVLLLYANSDRQGLLYGGVACMIAALVFGLVEKKKS